MATIILNEKVKVKVNTYEEAVALRRFLTERKYKGIRLGSMYLESAYRDEKEALEEGKRSREYKATYDGCLIEEAAMPMPIPVPVVTPPVPVTPVQSIEVVDSDGTTHKNHKEQSYEEWLETVLSSRKLTIDIENVLNQLKNLSLDAKKLGDFAAMEWDNTIRTTCNEEIVLLKFHEGSKDLAWKDRVNGEWVKFRGDETNNICRQSKWYGEDFGYISEWHARFEEKGYKLVIDFCGDNGFLDAKVSFREIREKEMDDNWLDPDIEEAMILGGCWD